MDSARLSLINNFAGHTGRGWVLSNQFFDKGRKRTFLSAEEGAKKHVFLRNEPISFRLENMG